MFTKHVTAPAQLKTAGADEGTISAVFSTFNVIDHDFDVTMPDAFTDGQEVMMVWSHDWTHPIGKGVIRVDQQKGHARFDGKFWLDTMAGEEAWKRVKNAGNLQEYSYGYAIKERSFGEFGDPPQQVQFLKTVDVFEVSPVLKGAAGSGNSYTLSVKDRRTRLSPDEVAEIEGIRDQVNNGVIFEMEKSRALGVPVSVPSKYHTLTLPQQAQIELIKARRLGVRV